MVLHISGCLAEVMMNHSAVELFALIMVFVLGLSFFGYRTYIAWLRPEEHQEYLDYRAGFFEGWPLGASVFWRSRFSFWLMRIAFTGAFVVMLFALLYLFSSLW
jgi:hypothetical protein